MAITRLILSALIAFTFYAGWAWYANSLVSSDSAVLLKAALVQGSYSGAMTLLFTAMLEYFFKRMGAKDYCLFLIAPHWSHASDEEPCATASNFKRALFHFRHGKHVALSGTLLVPLPALLLQTSLVIAINIAFATPNLWLTVLPSVVFSALYGYIYSIGLSKRAESS